MRFIANGQPSRKYETGWGGLQDLPVFCTLSLAYSIVSQAGDHRQPYYEGLFQEMLKA